jgi:5'-deoxynucleotidase YfbR-like HD superfamily hydrolase
MPVADDETHPLAGTVAFLFEMGYLKTLPRAGWLRLGNRTPESVAEHSFRVGILGMVLAELEGADAERTAALCVYHDAHETRIGDVPAVGRAYITTAKPEAITGHQTAGMPDDMSKLFQSLTAEFEAAETLEARVARDADKLETLLQAVEYGEQGYKTEAWVKTSVEALRTESAKQLAQAINAADPQEWWTSFAASYHELRASSRGRSR